MSIALSEQMLPIHEEQSRLWVDARTLHAQLHVGRDFSNWIKDRLSEIEAVENSDFIVLDGSPNLAKTYGGRPRRDYWLALDIAKEIAMLERNEYGKAIRRYFIEVEKQWREQQAPPLDLSDPLVMAEQLGRLSQQYIQAETERRALAAQAEANAPKIEVYDALVDSKGEHKVQAVAKMFGLGQNHLYNIMRDLGIIMRGTCEPYQTYIDDKYFVIKVTTYQRNGQEFSSRTTYVTGKGIPYLRKRLQKAGYLPPLEVASD